MEKEIKEQIFKMSEEELRDVNQLICARLRNLLDSREILSARKFSTGNRVSFESRHKKYGGGKIIIVIDQITGKRIHGHEDRNFGMKWSVSPSLCRLEPEDGV